MILLLPPPSPDTRQSSTAATVIPSNTNLASLNQDVSFPFAARPLATDSYQTVGTGKTNNKQKHLVTRKGVLGVFCLLDEKTGVSPTETHKG